MTVTMTSEIEHWDDGRIAKDLEESYRGVIEVLLSICLEGLRKSTKNVIPDYRYSVREWN